MGCLRFATLDCDKKRRTDLALVKCESPIACNGRSVLEKNMGFVIKHEKSSAEGSASISPKELAAREQFDKKLEIINCLLNRDVDLQSAFIEGEVASDIVSKASDPRWSMGLNSSRPAF